MQRAPKFQVVHTASGRVVGEFVSQSVATAKCDRLNDAVKDTQYKVEPIKS